MSKLALVALWVLCVICGVVALAWMLAAIVVGSPRAWRLARAWDRLGNAATGGEDTDTLSQRAWRWRASRRWARVLVRLVQSVDPDHFKDYPQ